MIISNTKLNNACLISVRVVIGKFGDILKKQRVEVNFIDKDILEDECVYFCCEEEQ